MGSSESVYLKLYEKNPEYYVHFVGIESEGFWLSSISKVSIF